MKVLKFGGTSVGSTESLLNVKSIVEAIPEECVIVVSALGGLTDKLISTTRIAAEGKDEWKDEMEAIKKRHYDITKNVVKPSLQQKLLDELDALLTELFDIYARVYTERNYDEKTLDEIVSFGERMSSLIVAAMIENGKRYYSPDFIKTEEWFGKNVANTKLTDKLIIETFANLHKNEKAIVPGFISKDSATERITNLGRGGSDYTAALIAAALKAEILEIWTDVDGFMTADPRIVKNAIIIDRLSFTESMELCSFGAKVIYPPTIYPVFHKNIPIKILNTFNPQAPGTLITDHPHNDDLEIKGVTALKEIVLISINNKSLKEEELSQRAYTALSKKGVRIITLNNLETVNIFNFAILASDLAVSMELLQKEFEKEIINGAIDLPSAERELTAVAVVGKDMKKKQRLSARIRHTLERQKIKVAAYSAGYSDISQIFIINQEKSTNALPLIHSLIYNSQLTD